MQILINTNNLVLLLVYNKDIREKSFKSGVYVLQCKYEDIYLDQTGRNFYIRMTKT